MGLPWPIPFGRAKARPILIPSELSSPSRGAKTKMKITGKTLAGFFMPVGFSRRALTASGWRWACRSRHPCLERSVIAPALLYLLQSPRASCPPVTLALPCASFPGVVRYQHSPHLGHSSRRGSRFLFLTELDLARPCARNSPHRTSMDGGNAIGL